MPRSRSAMRAPHLPEDILLQVFAGLEVPDLIRSGSVCTSWRAAYGTLLRLGRHKQQQTPCLLYTSKSSGERAAGLYSLADKHAYELPLPLPDDPPIRSRHLIGAAHGWLVTADERPELRLLNPVTGDQIALPPVTTMEQLTPIRGDDGAVREYRYRSRNLDWVDDDDGEDDDRTWTWIIGPRKMRNSFFRKAFLSSDPATGNFIVVLIQGPASQLSYARGGDDRWTLVPSSHYWNFEDCIFKDEELVYAVTKSGRVLAFDFSGASVKYSVVMEKVARDYITPWKMYVVEAPCGDLLLVLKDKHFHDLDFRSRKFRVEAEDVSEPGLYALEDDEDFSDPELDPLPARSFSYVFQVYRVDLAAQEFVEVKSLGKDVLFLGHNQSLCLSSQEHPQLKANHVYFTDDCEHMASRHKRRSRKMGVYDLGDDSTKVIVSPRVWSNWPAPLWITLNQRRMNSALPNAFAWV
ncbi:unnamed protein product [Urochloa decumbens]|uniref:F-box domain-containing protein n=1 Tax=Urochloa decumbens TaxID=240449 RepID=A0ABC9DL78_9POAL